MSIKPIETIYKGCRFRSRAEARWAVALDHMDIKWEYEPEGYILPDGEYYLPDFYFPEGNWYAEVKSQDKELSEEEINKIRQFNNNPPNSAVGIFTLTHLEPTSWSEKSFIQMQLIGHSYKGEGDFRSVYNSAVEKARQARFEFGETPT